MTTDSDQLCRCNHPLDDHVHYCPEEGCGCEWSAELRLNVKWLAEALHDAMCLTSAHDSFHRCNEWLKYPNIARFTARRYATRALAETPGEPP